MKKGTQVVINIHQRRLMLTLTTLIKIHLPSLLKTQSLSATIKKLMFMVVFKPA